jgi:hypothetical protein
VLVENMHITPLSSPFVLDLLPDLIIRETNITTSFKPKKTTKPHTMSSEAKNENVVETGDTIVHGTGDKNVRFSTVLNARRGS